MTYGNVTSIAQRATSGSITPSDSFSQRGLFKMSDRKLETSMGMETYSHAPPSTAAMSNSEGLRVPQSQPGQRPDDFPVEVLWEKDDCKKDTQGAKPQRNNANRPRMKYAIRDRDGTLISDSYFKTIQKSVSKQVAKLLQDEQERGDSRGGAIAPKKITKTHFESLRPKQWMHAIAVLEEEHPILMYAAVHWKAEQLLGNKLASKRNQLRKKQPGLPSKRAKRQNQSPSAHSSDDDGGETEESSKVSAQIGVKRKRAGTNVSEPTSAASKGMAIDEIDIQVDTETAQMGVSAITDTQSTSTRAVEKRIGKQGESVWRSLSNRWIDLLFHVLQPRRLQQSVLVHFESTPLKTIRIRVLR